MPASKLLIIHLSDIHICSADDAILKRPKDLARAAFSQLPQVDKVLIAISGDIAWSGKSAQYELAANFIDEFTSALQNEAQHLSIDVVVCPGNHDVDFSEHDEVREAVLTKVRSSGAKDVSQKLIDAATAAQENFFTFRKRVSTIALDFDNKLVWEHRLEVGGVRSAFDALT